MVTIKNKIIEIEKFENPQVSEKVKKLLERQSKCKTIEKYLESQLKVIRYNKENWTNIELVQVFEDLCKKANKLKSEAKVNLVGWKNKSSFQVIKKPDKFIIITYQKKDQDSEAYEVNTEITKEEVNEILVAIQQLNDGNKIPTRKIGELAYKKPWDDIFSNRKVSNYGNHIKLNLILRLLNHEGLIRYRSRFSTVLNKKLDIQEILK